MSGLLDKIGLSKGDKKASSLKKKKQSASDKKMSKKQKVVAKTDEKAKEDKDNKEKEKQKQVKQTGANFHRILQGYYATEKTSLGAPLGKYYFKVNPNSNKTEIKKAIESYYNVTVKMVNVINLKPKKTRFGMTMGKKKGRKKAVVSLKEGDSITFK